MSEKSLTQKLQSMTEGGKIAAEIMRQLVSKVEVGANIMDIELTARMLCSKYSVKPAFLGYRGYPSATCVMINNEVVHAIPRDYKFQDGEIVSIDFGIIYEGYYLDLARSIILGSNPEAEKLMKVAQTALDKAIAICKPGIKTGDIGATIQEYVEKSGFHILKDLGGHSIGKELHMSPIIANFGKRGTGEALPYGHTMAVEVIISTGTEDIVLDQDDGWTFYTEDGSLSAVFEETIYVGKTGGVILTKC